MSFLPTSAGAPRTLRSSKTARSTSPGPFPIAGHHFTSDLATGLGISPSAAEWAKLTKADLEVDSINQRELLTLDIGEGQTGAGVAQGVQPAAAGSSARPRPDVPLPAGRERNEAHPIRRDRAHRGKRRPAGARGTCSPSTASVRFASASLPNSWACLRSSRIPSIRLQWGCCYGACATNPQERWPPVNQPKASRVVGSREESHERRAYDHFAPRASRRTQRNRAADAPLA